jgi:hypothetical protein
MLRPSGSAQTRTWTAVLCWSLSQKPRASCGAIGRLKLEEDLRKSWSAPHTYPREHRPADGRPHEPPNPRSQPSLFSPFPLELERYENKACRGHFSLHVDILRRAGGCCSSIAEDRPPQTSPDTTAVDGAIKEKLESARTALGCSSKSAGGPHASHRCPRRHRHRSQRPIRPGLTEIGHAEAGCTRCSRRPCCSENSD